MKGKLSLVLIIMGVQLISSALLLTGYSVWKDNRASLSADSVRKQLQINPQKHPESTEPADNQIGDCIREESICDQLPKVDMPMQIVDGRNYIGVLEIPALNLMLPIMESFSYEGLEIAPCRFCGSAYTNDLVIAAHNYKAHFGSLYRLSKGDFVLLADIGGTKHRYQVVCVEKLKPSDMNLFKSDMWDLTLFTCTLGGEYRITVRCERVL